MPRWFPRPSPTTPFTPSADAAPASAAPLADRVLLACKYANLTQGQLFVPVADVLALAPALAATPDALQQVLDALVADGKMLQTDEDGTQRLRVLPEGLDRLETQYLTDGCPPALRDVPLPSPVPAPAREMLEELLANKGFRDLVLWGLGSLAKGDPATPLGEPDVRATRKALGLSDAAMLDLMYDLWAWGALKDESGTNQVWVRFTVTPAAIVYLTELFPGESLRG